MFSLTDWLIIAAYLLFTFSVGLLMLRKASTGLGSYFGAGRSLPWWWLGTSMVATTFAADTPLAVTGIVARDGIAGNWFVWCSTLTYMTMTVFFARKWHDSNVLTDVEIIALRYDGTSARVLRGFKAFYFSIIINSVVLGWVFRAMSKISQPFISWPRLLGDGLYVRLETLWPDFLIFDNTNNTLTVLVILAVVVAYSSLGGIRGVILTDLFQFALALLCAVVFAWFAVSYIGGLGELFDRLHGLYPDRADRILQFWPDFSGSLLPFRVFLIYIGLLWWAQYFSDGSGYLAQRINTARSPADAERGCLWFTLASFVLRTWPWIITALAALVIFPLDDPARFSPLGTQVAGDREMGYPVLMKLVLPPGVLGLTFVSLLAAFMSTVDTHINWAASYLVNDVYKPFMRPAASQRHYIAVSRLCVVLIAVVAVVIASQIDSIEKAWKFFVAIGCGLGLPQILRWVWWRANAWTEIAGMSVAFAAALLLYSLFPAARDEYLLTAVIGASVTACIGATLITRPVHDTVLRRFIDRVRPFGFWRKMNRHTGAEFVFVKRGGMWVLGVTATFSGMFSIGYLLMARWAVGLLNAVIFILCMMVLLSCMKEKPCNNHAPVW